MLNVNFRERHQLIILLDSRRDKPSRKVQNVDETFYLIDNQKKLNIRRLGVCLQVKS